MEKKILFREEAMHNRLHRSMGTLCINVPLNYKVISICSFLMIFIFILFLCFAQTTEKISIRGFLDAEGGIAAVHSEFSGIIVQSNIEEGKKVDKGAVLYVVSHEGHEKNKRIFINLKQRINNLKREYGLKKEHYQSLSLLFAKHYVSTAALKNTEAELLEINNKIKLLDLEFIKYKQSQYHFIKSPITGVITNIFYKTGQSITPSIPMLQIIPLHSKLIARLYVPSRDIGFLKKGAQIFIKYDAYPAQRFGMYKAAVKEVNLTVLTDEKEDKPIKVGQPYYRIKADLETPYINLYGKKTDLSHGMTFTGIIEGDKKKVWQWILDPLYSYYGGVFL